MKKLRWISVALVLVLFFSLLQLPVLAADKNIVSSGTVVLKNSFMLNCENGVIGKTGDIWWSQQSGTARQLAPVGNAQVYNMGKVEFANVTAASLVDLPFTTTPIVGNNDSTNQLVVGDVFVVRTKTGHYTKILVKSYGTDLTIEWVTYKASLTAPSIVSPTSGIVLNNYPRVTTLVWKPVAGAVSYKVEIQYYTSKWEIIPTVTLNGNKNCSYNFEAIGDNKLRWRVRAYSAKEYSAFCAWKTINYSTKAKLVPPVLVSPSNNTTFYHYPRIMTLSWKQVMGATGYVVEVQYYGKKWLAYPNINISSPLSTSYTFSFIGAQKGRWRVTAIGKDFYNSSPSDWRYFTFKI